MSNPASGPSFGCPRCWPEDPGAAWEARAALGVEQELIDESHLGVSLLACAGCGQRFASVFLEQVDWVDGDDPQYWTIVPLTPAESDTLRPLGRAALVEQLETIGFTRPCLHRDYPKGAEPGVGWRRGVTLH